MFYTKSLFAILAVLILIGQAPTASPASVAPAYRFPLQQIDQDRIDAYIQSRMQVANIPGLALAVIYGDQIVYLKGYGIAGPDGRAVTPQTPFILGSTSKSITALAALLIPVLWIVWSYFSIRRWQRHGELPPHGISRFWRLYLPLTIDFCPVALAWIIVPAQFHTLMETIALFTPDVFIVIVTLTALCFGWAMARIFLTLYPRRLIKHASH